MVNKCTVPGCSNESYSGCLITFFKFPKDKDLKQQWLSAIGKKSVGPSSRICHYHFKPEDMYFTISLKRHLNPDAVPIILCREIYSKEIQVQSKPQFQKQPALTIISKIQNTELTDQDFNSTPIFKESQYLIPNYIDRSVQALPRVTVASTQTLKNTSHVAIQTKHTKKETLMKEQIRKLQKQNLALRQELAELKKTFKNREVQSISEDSPCESVTNH